ncbi:MAG: VIT domain-containing protein [Planctomycetota bacterium]|nr:VIT domain-containing protein [Planctomycetota bacterium]
MTAVRVRIEIEGRLATTILQIDLENSSGVAQEAKLELPVPGGVVVRRFAFHESGGKGSARLVAAEEAREAYEALVSRTRDPALLEFVGHSSLRTSVFPVPAGGKQRVRLVYEELLPVDGNRIDYQLLRAETTREAIPWEVSVRVRSNDPIATLYSPTHQTQLNWNSSGEATLNLVPDARREPGPFRLVILRRSKAVTGSLILHPDPEKGGGTFLFLAGAPGIQEGSDNRSQSREVTLVLDRSGSMRGPKMEQLRRAARRILKSLGPEEYFNLIAYHQAVDSLSPTPLLATQENVARALRYIEGIVPMGGTHLYSALGTALRQPPSEGSLPVVLFLTDGLSTIGETSERAIRDLATKGNPHQRRIFTVGVGLDVNTPLLEALADRSRARATFVLPGEDIENRMARLFRKLSGPILSGPSLRVLDANGRPTPGRVMDLHPGLIPDVFVGDQLVLLGRYRGEGDGIFELRGNHQGRQVRFSTRVSFSGDKGRNGFVARLWAHRQIARFVDALRQMGADRLEAGSSFGMDDPRRRELVDEIVRLSLKFGILTEYTAFFAREGVDLFRKDQILTEAWKNLQKRALRVRSGVGSVNQSLNAQIQKDQKWLNHKNVFLNENLERIEPGGVQQVANLAFFRQGERWVDSRILNRSMKPKIKRTIEFGTEEYRKLLFRLIPMGQQGVLALRGEVILESDGETVLVTPPK